MKTMQKHVIGRRAKGLVTKAQVIPSNGDSSSEESEETSGFRHFPIQWFDFDGELLKKVKDTLPRKEWPRAGFGKYLAEGLMFRVEVRMTRFNVGHVDTNGWAVDIYVRPKPAEHPVLAHSIPYVMEDPRLNLISLEADICAATMVWLNRTAMGKRGSFDQLLFKANHPTITISRLETIDRLLLKLREFRDTAIKCGGQRTFEIHGDVDGEPGMRIAVNFTSQAIALDGKRAPSLEMGGVLDVVKRSSREAKVEGKVRGQTTVNAPAQGNVNDLLKALEKARAAGNKAQCGKIRGILRKMGHRGGSRAAK